MTKPKDRQPPVALIKVDDVATAYGVHPRTVLRWVKRGALTPVPVPFAPQMLRFDPSVLPTPQQRRPAA